MGVLFPTAPKRAAVLFPLGRRLAAAIGSSCSAADAPAARLRAVLEHVVPWLAASAARAGHSGADDRAAVNWRSHE
jgi:hypothetical protein